MLASALQQHPDTVRAMIEKGGHMCVYPRDLPALL